MDRDILCFDKCPFHIEISANFGGPTQHRGPGVGPHYIDKVRLSHRDIIQTLTSWRSVRVGDDITSAGQRAEPRRRITGNLSEVSINSTWALSRSGHRNCRSDNT